MGIFDYINAINFTKVDQIEEEGEKGYDCYMTNKSLSYFSDTVLFANEMNIHYSLPKRTQFDFLRFGVSKRKRFAKWHKAEKNDELVDKICNQENISQVKVRQMISLLTDSQIKQLKIDYGLKNGKNSV